MLPQLLPQSHGSIEAFARSVGYLLLTLIKLPLNDELGICALEQLVVCHTDSSLLLLHLLLQGALLGDQCILQLCQGSIFGIQSGLPVLPGFL